MLATTYPSIAGHGATVAPQPWRSSLPRHINCAILTTLYFALVPQKF
jgi:hypothetical protein